MAGRSAGRAPDRGLARRNTDSRPTTRTGTRALATARAVTPRTRGSSHASMVGHGRAAPPIRRPKTASDANNLSSHWAETQLPPRPDVWTLRLLLPISDDVHT